MNSVPRPAADFNTKQKQQFGKLLHHLWRGGSWGYLWFVTQDGKKHTKWFDSRIALRVATDKYVSKRMDQNIYFGIHPTNIFGTRSTRSLKAPDPKKPNNPPVVAVNCLFADFDTKDLGSKDAIMDHLADFPTPNVIIDSGGGYHCYWLLGETMPITDDNREHVIEIQERWVDYIGSDRAVKDLARVLRVPGTRNMKPDYAPDHPVVTVTRFDMENLYTWAELVELLPPVDDVSNWTQSTPAQTSTNGTGPTLDLTDAELVERASQAKNGPKFQRLWDGVITGYPSQSEADQALCNLLAWWTDGDAGRVDRLFRASGLFRDKWDREDYRSKTIATALESVGTGYRPTTHTNGSGPRPAQTVATTNGTGPGTGTITNGTPYDEDTPPEWMENAPPVDMATGEVLATGGDYLLTETTDDEGNAQCVHRRFSGGFLHTGAYGWMHYTGTHWDSSTADYMVDRAIVDTLTARQVAGAMANRQDVVSATRRTKTKMSGAKTLLQSISFADAKDFDKEPHLLNTAGGVLDLRTGDVVPHNPGQRFTYCIPVEYDPSADKTPWLDFLASVVGDYDQVSEWLQMAVGYSLTGSTREECLFYLFGPTRSGKGTFTNTILSMLGSPLGRGVSFNTFTQNRDGSDQGFDLAPLKPARFISASESGKYDSMNEAVVKTITGGDPITAAFKRRDQFTYIPQYKIWVASNHPVKGDVDDDAFWGRVKVLHFPKSHLGTEDKLLKQRLSTPSVLAGVLAWAVAGAMKWYAAPQGLTTPAAVSKWTRAQRDELDFVARWLGECCTVGGDELFTTNAVLYASYKNWCQDNGVMPKHAAQWGRALESKGLTQDRRRIDSKVQRGRVGVEIVTL